MKKIELSFVEIKIKRVEYEHHESLNLSEEIPNFDRCTMENEFNEVENFEAEFGDFKKQMKKKKLSFNIVDLYEKTLYSTRFYTQFDFLAYLPIILNAQKYGSDAADDLEHFLRDLLLNSPNGAPDIDPSEYFEGLSTILSDASTFYDLPENINHFFKFHALFYELIFNEDSFVDLYMSLLGYPNVGHYDGE
jgi:hypothetical protein